METEAQTSMTRMTTHRILALTKRGLLFLLLAFSPFQLFTLLPLHLHAQGIPFFRNFMPEDYHANSFNFKACCFTTTPSGRSFTLRVLPA